MEIAVIKNIPVFRKLSQERERLEKEAEEEEEHAALLRVKWKRGGFFFIHTLFYATFYVFKPSLDKELFFIKASYKYILYIYI